jgi:hypothetical protein
MLTANSITGAGRILDTYSLRARWSPVLLVALPLIVACVAFVPSLSAWDKLWPFLGGAAVVVLVDQLGRDAGKRMQPSLWASWGGAPTTTALRHRDSRNPVLLARRHQQLQTVLGRALPTEHEERADPIGADHAYEAVTSILISRTRERRQDFPLIFVENCNYGFRRNMLGLRPWGMSVSSLAAVAVLAGLATTLAGLTKFSTGLLGIALAVSVIMLLIWWKAVARAWVRRVAETYADRLFEAAESLLCDREPRHGADERAAAEKLMPGSRGRPCLIRPSHDFFPKRLRSSRSASTMRHLMQRRRAVHVWFDWFCQLGAGEWGCAS